jgi:predicted transglutaminase-like cysteine proteinase
LLSLYNKLNQQRSGYLNLSNSLAQSLLQSVLVAIMLIVSPVAQADPFSAMFGYDGVEQADIGVFPQWLNVLKTQNLNKDSNDNWHQFLSSIRNKSSREQLDAVNRYVNRQDYVVDIDNYGANDHWAQPTEFLENGGDCEDFAILKFFSLRWLGWPAEKLRLVVVQDTKMRQSHAVLAVATDQDVVILDNQTPGIVSPESVPHYAPVYSISDEQWWLHLPNS